ncbi:MAG: hydantoinase/oxoprolinase family protein, partial [Gammaproteobacteria bacterium]|nr:hydantoinase/oxoprolinase family protein [Gammaproteobacteria bacterium]
MSTGARTASGRGSVRLAVDIGGTFTDVALESDGRHITGKVLTTPSAPELGVLEGIDSVLGEAGRTPDDVALIIHGTTLGTNAIIERKGARTALIVTEGFRDSVEMAYENRFDQYDIAIHKPAPLVPRDLRFGVRERVAADGEVLIPLDEPSVRALIESLDRAEVQSVAVALLHAYRAPEHEQRVAEILHAARPDLAITLSSEVCPEIREYERMSTACANAYIQPLMARYLSQLDARLRSRGFGCPLLLMMSSGGLTTLDTALRFPVRLVESGPAGGAILAAEVAREIDASEVLSFDMGGTTAKVCL